MQRDDGLGDVSMEGGGENSRRPIDGGGDRSHDKHSLVSTEVVEAACNAVTQWLSAWQQGMVFI